MFSVPEIGLSTAVTIAPKSKSSPYSKVTVVSFPFALTVPFRVAPVELILVAVLVVTVGVVAFVYS